MKRVLVIDDQRSCRLIVRTVLERKLGCEVREAENGLVGARAILEFKPDLVTCDVNMPIADGFMVCKMLKSNVHTKHIPVMLVTYRGEEVSKDRGASAGADDYVQKPIDAEDFIVRVRALLEAPGKIAAEAPEGAPVACPAPRGSSPDLVVLTGGAGGVQSLEHVAKQLSHAPACAVLVSLAIPAFACGYHLKQLHACLPGVFDLGQEGTLLRPGKAYLLPGEGPTLVPVRAETGEMRLHREPNAESTGTGRADLILSAAARVAGARAAGVVLSGTGCDGLDGLAAMLSQGAATICEEPGQAMVSQLPQAAMGRKLVTAVLTRRGIAQWIDGLQATTRVTDPAQESPPR